MKLTFLEAKIPLTKTFSMVDGKLVKDGAPNVLNFKSHFVEVSNLDEFYAALVDAAAKGWCLQKGNVTRELNWESRAGASNPNEETEYLVLDLDGEKHAKDVDEVMKWLDLSGVDYILQHSASSGVVPDRGISAHAFVLTDRSNLPTAIKHWLVDKNLRVHALRQGIGLTRSGNALRYALDTTTCQSDKLIYIAPPVLKEGVEDKFEGERIQIVRHGRERASIDFSKVSAQANSYGIQEVLDERRKAANLETKGREWNREKTGAGGVIYMPDPDEANLTGLREDRGFVYMNLNGGDSWGYYHPRSNPDYILNFKGEPAYKTSELLPDYWKGLKAKEKTRQELVPALDGRIYLGFRGFNPPNYWNGFHDPATDYLELGPARSWQQVVEFLAYNRQGVPDLAPVWDDEWEPNNDKVIDVKAKHRTKINRYIRSEFERQWRRMSPEEQKRADVGVPPIVAHVLRHVVAEDQRAYDYFLNWLACILQLKCNTGCAIVWQGIEGTGKGLFREHMLGPMIGEQNVQSRQQKDLLSEFDGWLDSCQFCWVDEVRMTDAGWETGQLEGWLKHHITDDTFMVRPMYSPRKRVKSYINFLFPSNKHDSVVVSPTDRRFDVAPYQSKALPWDDAKMEEFKAAAWPLYCHLMRYPADRSRARKPEETEAKSDMKSLSVNAVDNLTAALRSGDLRYLKDMRPESADDVPNSDNEAAKKYMKLVEFIDKERPKCLFRDEIHTIVNFVIGPTTAAPGKLTQYLGYHGIKLVPVGRGGKERQRGIRIEEWHE